MSVINEYTYGSFVNEAMNRKKHKNCGGDSSRSDDFDFTQTKSFEEACDFAINGWDLGLKEFEVEDGVMTSGSTYLLPSLAGSIPHVQNHIMDFPQQMFQLNDEREYNLPRLDIYVNLPYKWSVSSEKTLRFGKSLVAYINKMASKYNIRLTGFFATEQKKDVIDFVYIKDFDEAMVINNIAYAFHPSFFRRLWFSVLEGKEYWAYGYGRSQSENQYKEYVIEKINKDKPDKVVVFKNLEDIGNWDWDEENGIENVTLDWGF